mgnify:FL=1
MEKQNKENLKELQLVKDVEVSTESREAKKDIENDTSDKVDEIGLKALAFISSWNQYSNGK